MFAVPCVSSDLLFCGKCKEASSYTATCVRDVVESVLGETFLAHISATKQQ